MVLFPLALHKLAMRHIRSFVNFSSVLVYFVWPCYLKFPAKF